MSRSADILFLPSMPLSVTTTVTMYTLSLLASAGASKLGVSLKVNSPGVAVSLIADVRSPQRQRP